MADQPSLRPGWRLVAIVYLIAVGATTATLVVTSLTLSSVCVSLLRLLRAVLAGLVLGLPVAWVFARHIRRLMIASGDQ